MDIGFLGKKITINMAPADIRKEGSAYDLSLALGILAASRQIESPDISHYLIMGELSLDGGLRPIKGGLPMALQAKKDGFKGFILPAQNAPEAGIVDGLDVFGVNNLNEAIDVLTKPGSIAPIEVDINEAFAQDLDQLPFDFSEVKGQENVKRALEIAAAGGTQYYFDRPAGSRKNHAG